MNNLNIRRQRMQSAAKTRKEEKEKNEKAKEKKQKVVVKKAKKKAVTTIPEDAIKKELRNALKEVAAMFHLSSEKSAYRLKLDLDRVDTRIGFISRKYRVSEEHVRRLLSSLEFRLRYE